VNGNETTNHVMTASDLSAVELLHAAAQRARELDAAATPGPWETGSYYLMAGVLERLFGPGRCTYCASPGVVAGEIVWRGRTDINGTIMEAHLHRASIDMGVASVWACRPDGMRGLVVMDDGEDGIDLDDLRFVAAFRAVAAPLANLLAAFADPVDDEVRNVEELLVALARALLPDKATPESRPTESDGSVTPPQVPPVETPAAGGGVTSGHPTAGAP